MGYGLQFVDSISASPTVRLDLNLAPWRLRDTTTFGQASLRRAVVSTLLFDGERYPAAAYDNRLLTLVLKIDGLGDDATAAALQQLYRELDRPANILRYQPATSQPVFFRIFRSTPDAVTWNPVEKEATVRVPAEPFALGLRQTLSPVTVTNSPAGGLYWDMADVAGDVETPLFLQFTTSTVIGSGHSPTSVIGVRRRGTPSAMPMVLQAESMTMGTDTTVQPNDPLMSGAGSNFIRCSFATQTALVARATIAGWPSGSSVDYRGTYRVFLRGRSSDPNFSSFQASLVTDGPNGIAGVSVTNGPVSLSAFGATPSWVDMGLIEMPAGSSVGTDGYSGSDLPVRGIYLALWLARTAGTGTLDIDCLVLVPADDRLLLIDWASVTIAADYLVLDSARTTVYALDSGGAVWSGFAGTLAGGPPMVSPGVTNRIVFVLDVDGIDLAGTLTTTTVTPYYWPRYLTVRPPSS